MGMALLCTFSLFMGMIANAKTKTSGVHQNQLEEYILKENAGGSCSGHDHFYCK